MCTYLSPRRELLEYFREIEGQYTPLAALLLTSKRLSHLIIPLLYTSFSETGIIRKLPLFLRTILSRPNLAQHVRSISLCDFQHKKYAIKLTTIINLSGILD